MNEREAATARLAEAFAMAVPGNITFLTDQDSVWDNPFQVFARIAIEEAVVPVWEEAPPFYADGRLCTKPIPWSAICPEEK